MSTGTVTQNGTQVTLTPAYYIATLAPGRNTYPYSPTFRLSAAATPTQLAVATQPPGSVTASKGFGLVVSVENAAGNPDIGRIDSPRQVKGLCREVTLACRKRFLPCFQLGGERLRDAPLDLIE